MLLRKNKIFSLKTKKKKEKKREQENNITARNKCDHPMRKSRTSFSFTEYFFGANSTRLYKWSTSIWVFLTSDYQTYQCIRGPIDFGHVIWCEIMTIFGVGGLVSELLMKLLFFLCCSCLTSDHQTLIQGLTARNGCEIVTIDLQ